MPEPTTRSRQELRTRFVRNAIPTEADFHDLINASLNLADDGLHKLPEQPLGLVRQKTEQPAVLRLYADAAAAEAAWQMQLIGENNPSFGLAGSNQSLALFIEGGTQNVGIGTAEPKAKLHVAGSLQVDNMIQLGLDREIFFEGNGKIRSRSDNHALLFRASENILEIREWGDIVLTAGCGGSTPLVPKLVVKETGSVGIGTTSPTAKLEVSNGSIKISSDDHGIDFSGGAKIYKKSGSGLKIKPNNDTHGIEFLKADGTTSVLKIVEDRLVIGTSTTKSDAKLHVAGSLSIDANMTLGKGDIRFSSDNNNGIDFFGGAKIYKKFGSGLKIKPHNDNDGIEFLKADGTTSVMKIEGDRLVIGTSTPIADAKLHVGGSLSIDDNMTLRRGSINFRSDNNNGIDFSQGAKIYMVAGSGLKIKPYHDHFGIEFLKADGTTSVLKIVGDSLGIGTRNPEQKLHVEGKIRLSDVPVWDGPSGYDLTWVGKADRTTGDKFQCIARAVSSRRYKKNIIPFEDNFMKLLRLEPHKYQMREGYGTPGFWSFGYLAEDLDQLGLKTLVTYNEAGQPEGINYKKICIYLNEILKQQQECLMDLESQIRKLSQAINPPPNNSKSTDNE